MLAHTEYIDAIVNDTDILHPCQEGFRVRCIKSKGMCDLIRVRVCSKFKTGSFIYKDTDTVNEGPL